MYPITDHKILLASSLLLRQLLWSHSLILIIFFLSLPVPAKNINPPRYLTLLDEDASKTVGNSAEHTLRPIYFGGFQKYNMELSYFKYRW